MFCYSSPNRLRQHTYGNIKNLTLKNIFLITEGIANILPCAFWSSCFVIILAGWKLWVANRWANWVESHDERVADRTPGSRSSSVSPALGYLLPTWHRDFPLHESLSAWTRDGRCGRSLAYLLGSTHCLLTSDLTHHRKKFTPDYNPNPRSQMESKEVMYEWKETWPAPRFRGHPMVGLPTTILNPVLPVHFRFLTRQEANFHPPKTF